MLALGFVALALASFSNASPLDKRAFTCPQLTAQVAAADIAAATPFCSSYLGLVTRTATATSITGTQLATATVSAMVTSIRVTTPAVLVSTQRVTTTTRATAAPTTITYTQTTTQTKYLNNDGSLIAQEKRGLFARATATPSALAALSLNHADMSAACSCLAIPTPTITRWLKAKVTSYSTTAYTRTKNVVSTASAPLTTTTLAFTRTINIVPEAVHTTFVVNQIDTSYSCPPDYTTTWACPAGLGADESTDPQELDCPVAANDGFQGDCIYWNDDGSPAGSQLAMGDGSGDPDNNQYRDATYGDQSTDDCPSWADYKCAAGTRLERLAREVQNEKRRLRSPKKTTAQYQAHKSSGLKKLPIPAPKRGGKFRGFKGSAPVTTTIHANKQVAGPTYVPAANGKFASH